MTDHSDDSDSLDSLPPAMEGSPVAVLPRNNDALNSTTASQDDVRYGKEKCKCNYEGCRRSRSSESDWEPVKTIEIQQRDNVNQEEALNAAIYEAEQWMAEQSQNNFMDNWKCNDDVAKKGRPCDKEEVYKVSYRCRYRDLCDCSCKFQLRHKLGSPILEINWFVKGSAHGISPSSSQTSSVFASIESHNEFQHIRLPLAEGNTNKMLPIEMLELIECLIFNNNKIKPNDMISYLRAYKNDNDLVWNYSPGEWSRIRTKIMSATKTARKTIKQLQGEVFSDTLHDLQKWAVNNTYEEVLKREKERFDLFTMFVAGHDIASDHSLPPQDKNERKKWKPQHKCRIVLTSVAMSMFTPAIACRGDVFGRIHFSADATYKIFLAQNFRVIGLYVTDATMSAKLIGIEITCNENGGDYYLSAMACRNVTEHICSLPAQELPGNIKELPFRLPSPVPPFTKTKPLSYNAEQGTYQQLLDDFPTCESERYFSNECKEAREEKVTSHVRFSPSLVSPVPEGESSDSFRLDLDGLESHTGSDGAKAISVGLGAAMPITSQTR